MTRTEDEKRIMRTLNGFIGSGRRFTVDEIWDRVDISPAPHKSWLGRQIQLLADAGRIETVDWRFTSRSLPHSRPARVWQGIARARRAA
jgi:ribosomal protein L31